LGENGAVVVVDAVGEERERESSNTATTEIEEKI